MSSEISSNTPSNKEVKDKSSAPLRVEGITDAASESESPIKIKPITKTTIPRLFITNVVK